MDLLEAISAFDGKRVAPLEAFCDEAIFDEPLLRELVEICVHGETRQVTAASWILLQFARQNDKLVPELSKDLCRAFCESQDWEPQLHMLQAFSLFQLETEERELAAQRCRELSAAENKLVRAWSLYGLVCIAKEDPAFRDEAQKLCEQGLDDPAASVRARARRLTKELEQQARRD